MTVARLRETRGYLAGMPNGAGYNDPAAIPPPNMFSMNRAGVPVTPDTSMQVDVVFTALRVISNAVVKMGDLFAFRYALDKDFLPYRLRMEKQPKILTSTFGRLFQYDGRRQTTMSMGLFGEAFWYTLTRDRLQYPAVIEVLNPAFVEVKQDKVSGDPLYYYGTGSKKKLLDTDDVTHIPFMAMPGAARGMSSIKYAGVSYALALAAMEYGQRWFSQGASPSFLLSTDMKLGPEEITRIAEKFLVEHSGLQAAHLPLVVDRGLKATKISSTPDEAQFINTLEYARMCIASWFGLPSHLVGGVGDKGNVWGRTVAEQSMQMLIYTLSGYTVPMEEAHSQLLPAGQFAGFNEGELSKPDAADMAAKITALRQTQVATQNDIRVRELKWAPVEGGDELSAPLASNVAPDASSAAVADATNEDDAGGSGSGGN
jgi:HK97 family phage portal protein